jgi:protein-disulfide isomerase
MRNVTLLVSGVLTALVLAACGGSVTPTPLVPTVPTFTQLPSVEEMLAEKVLGNPGAKNTIIEYVSFWCPSCKAFHTDIEPQLKSRYVDTGQATVIFRNLMLFGQGETEATPALARCVGNAKFYDAVDFIFARQSTWLGTSNPLAALEQSMLGFGMSQSLIDACVASSGLRTGLSQVHDVALAATYQLPDGTSVVGFRAVPAIVVNGVALDGRVADGTANDNTATLANIERFLIK